MDFPSFCCSSESDGKIVKPNHVKTFQHIQNLIQKKFSIPLCYQRILYGGKDINHASFNQIVISNNTTSNNDIWLEVCLKLTGGAKKKKDKKGKKGGKKKADAEPTQEPDQFDAMNGDELKKVRQVLENKVNTVKQQRSYFQLERDQIQKIYDLVNKEYQDCQVHIKNMESDIESMKNNHRNNIRMYVQKVKHLEYDHSNTINAVSLEMAMVQDDEIKNQESRKDELQWQKKVLKQELNKQKLSNQDEIIQLRENQNKELVKLEEEFEQNFQKLKHEYKLQVEELQSDLELQTKV